MSTLNIRVTLMLIPSAIAFSMAGIPASVAGILMNTFGRSSRAHSSRARSSVASASWERSGSTSMLAKPSAPSASSCTRRRTSAASPTSDTAISSYICRCQAAGAGGFVVHASQDVGGVADVGHGDFLVDLARPVAGLDLTPDQLVVLAGRDGRGEDRRVAG